MEKGQRLGWVQWVPNLKFGILNEDDWRRGSRERVTEDKIGGGGAGMESMIAGTGGCIPGLRGVLEPGARKMLMG